eukprot:gnl/Spiro4/28273_TR13983_c0_g1_i1.p1 gnl/Spiro4/28273_TR13983_c0_g1~~gnl/Spiro4/28273_TR13983_c0_g1_i1.p1  ORF type:complete len:473 (+),score=136.51 gnl/Spiro4/28273_TR13983_c0_g1_i1:61-1419(+)
MSSMFFCQNCRHPLEIDEDDDDAVPQLAIADSPPASAIASAPRSSPLSFSARTASSVAAPTSASPTSPPPAAARIQHSSGSSALRPTLSATSLSSSVSVAESLPTAVVPPGSKLIPLTSSPSPSSRAEMLQKLCEYAQEHTRIEHPLCNECAEQVLGEAQRRVLAAQRERDGCLKLLEDLSAHEAADCLTDAGARHHELEADERALMEQLAALEASRDACARDRAKLRQQAALLDELELRYWREFNTLQAHASAFRREQDTVRQQLEHAGSDLERLKRCNVFNDTFHIWHDGHCGTINSFHLGCLPSQPIKWDEINAALGQVCLCLDVLARRRNFSFQHHQLLPMGSTSRICKRANGKTYDLFGSNEISIGRLFWTTRLDKALVWLLGCVRELGEHAQTHDPQFRFPYRIGAGTIETVSVKINNNFSSWTKAMKFMLTNIKWLLVWLIQTNS